MHDGLSTITERLRGAEAKAGRDPGSVRLIAVSKVQTDERVDLADVGRLLEKGLGERRVDNFWYVRLKIIVFVIRAVLTEKEDTPLTGAMVDGVDRCLDALLDRLIALDGAPSMRENPLEEIADNEAVLRE